MLNIRIKALRKGRNKTQQDIATILGVSRPAYTAYEQGNRTPDNETIEKLADYYDVTIDYLYGRTDNPNRISDKDERDIAKRLESFKEDLENSDGLAFDGEPMSDEAKESLLESMELLFKQTQRINKKFTPKKFREDE
ncbi:hypothetical protein CSE16_12100 [Solibacillus sp. R5-41]|uniref:helix-turn-helix domain-containing protein n=1 Tax=Solibacillus sp. R5-41 TaxID=2048654 RepID=UPI000C128A48|nr:helix-turn-helix transcriptional regulator [Solibacillus sp. R5-41]ATP40729.1 hypothetical protein CSE16_12100 [Solibacillus sp. R5-41]